MTDVGLLDGAQTAAIQDYVENGGRALLAAGPRSSGLTALPITGQPLRTNPQMGRQASVAIGEVDASASRAARSRGAAGRELLPLHQRRTR